MKARSEFPHPSPRVWYMLLPANGSKAPKSDRNMVLAASAEAACKVKASTR